MAITIGMNIASLNALGKVQDAYSRFAKSAERLSSGLRINSASDDAAGLALSTSLKANTRIYTQALRNVNDAASLFNIAEGALNSLSNIVTRQLELAQQASSGTYSSSQLEALNEEANALVNEYNRIIDSTKFNGMTLLDGSFQNFQVQVGNGGTINDFINFSLGVTLTSTTGGGETTVNDGTFNARTQFPTGFVLKSLLVADVNNDGIQDVIAGSGWGGLLGVGVMLGNADGSLNAIKTYYTGTAPQQISVGDFNEDGNLDIVSSSYISGNIVTILYGNANGTFNARVTLATDGAGAGIQVADFDGDGNDDIAVTDWTNSTVEVYMGCGDGTFAPRVSYATGTRPYDLVVKDINGDNYLDLITADSSGGITILLANSNGTFKAATTFVPGVSPHRVRVGDLNGDGKQDLVVQSEGSSAVRVLLGHGDGTFDSAVSYVTGATPTDLELRDMNGDGFLDIISGNTAAGSEAISILFGNGNGTFNARISLPSASGGAYNQVEIADMDGDGAWDIVGSSPGVSVILGNSSTSGGGGEETTTLTPYEDVLDLTTQTAAQDEIDYLNSVLSAVTQELGNVGSALSRLQHVNELLTVQRENLAAAYSRISDVDVANEVAGFLRTQILLQAATAILAQANQQPEIVTKLLLETT